VAPASRTQRPGSLQRRGRRGTPTWWWRATADPFAPEKIRPRPLFPPASGSLATSGCTTCVFSRRGGDRPTRAKRGGGGAPVRHLSAGRRRVTLPRRVRLASRTRYDDKAAELKLKVRAAGTPRSPPVGSVSPEAVLPTTFTGWPTRCRLPPRRSRILGLTRTGPARPHLCRVPARSISYISYRAWASVAVPGTSRTSPPTPAARCPGPSMWSGTSYRAMRLSA